MTSRDLESQRRDAEAKICQIESARSDADAARLMSTDKIMLMVTAAAIVVGWAHTFGEMWLRWFPAWHRRDLSMSSRFTEGDSYYTHGPLVPLTCIVIAIFIYRRVGAPVHRTKNSTRWGWLLFGGSLLLQLVAAKAGVNYASGFALIGVLGGMVLLWGGWPLARAYWLPIVLLFFMVPLPMGAIASLNFKLKYFASSQALWITRSVFGVPAFTDGSIVHLPPMADGTPKHLVVENVCSGLRSLISLTFFAALFAVVCRATGAWRLVLLAMAVPVAILSNIIRISALNVVAHHYSVAAAGPGGTFHDMSGILIFLVALAILFGLEWMITRLGKLLHRNWTDNRLLGYLNDLPRSGRQRPAVSRPTIILAIVAIAALSVFWSNPIQATQFSRMTAGAVPRKISIGATTFTGTEQEISELVKTVLQTDDIINIAYKADAGREQFSLMIVFSQNNRKGTHEPEVCIEGGGSQLVSKQLRNIKVAGVGSAEGIPMREMVSQDGSRKYLHLYVYKAGSTYTTSFFYQQLCIFLNGLFDANSAGALIRFDVPVVGDQTGKARHLAEIAAQKMMTNIDRNLP